MILKRQLQTTMIPLPEPQYYDYISSPETTNPETLQKQLEAFEKACIETQLANSIRFNNALPWVKQCAMLYGFTHWIMFSDYNTHIIHKNWCPAPYWLHLS